MPKMTSIQQMAKLCEGLVDTKDVNEWENRFLRGVCFRVDTGQPLSEKQEEHLEKIYRKHFADTSAEGEDNG